MNQGGSDDEEGGGASSDVEDDLVQRLKNLEKPNDPDLLTRLPVRVSPKSHDPAERNQDSPLAGDVEPVPSEVLVSLRC